jgi:hypothetical protein
MAKGCTFCHTQHDTATYLVGIQALLQVLKLHHLVWCDNLTVQATHTKVCNQRWSKHILIQPSRHLLRAAIKQKQVFHRIRFETLMTVSINIIIFIRDVTPCKVNSPLSDIHGEWNVLVS